MSLNPSRRRAHYALLGCLLVLAAASVPAAEAIPPSTPASACMNFATEGFPDAGGKPGDRIKGARSLTFEATLPFPVLTLGGIGPSCDVYGSRTVQVWEVMANDKGKVRRNSPVLDLVKDSNAALPWTWFTLKLFKPYTCLPRPAKGHRRRHGRYWGFTERVIATYGGKTEKPQNTLDGDTFFGSYVKLC